MMRLLQINKDRISEQERIVLDQLERRYRDGVVRSFLRSFRDPQFSYLTVVQVPFQFDFLQNGSIESLISAHPTVSLPVFNESDLEVVKRGGHLSLPKKPIVKKEGDFFQTNFQVICH